eukprot:scaffold359282_cov51-Prasinocladus_malaysianus.AAC.2
MSRYDRHSSNCSSINSLCCASPRWPGQQAAYLRATIMGEHRSSIQMRKCYEATCLVDSKFVFSVGANA